MVAGQYGGDSILIRLSVVYTFAAGHPEILIADLIIPQSTSYQEVHLSQQQDWHNVFSRFRHSIQ
jgi:hypothetical protein